MAEINKSDLFSEEALKAPLELAKNLGAVAAAIDAITAASKRSEEQLKGTQSVSKITKETEKLTAQEKELIKVQASISTALAKNNDEYRDHQKGLAAINAVNKERLVLGNKNAKTIDAETASLNELKAALIANRAAYDALSTAEKRNGKEGQELLAIIQKQDEALKASKDSMGQHQLHVGNYKDAVKELKEQLKEAKGAMLLAADAGGTMSEEYQKAAKQAGEIADKIGDAKDEAKVFANDTAFGSLGTRVGLLKDKVKSLDFKGVGEQLKGLSKIILTNPIFILVGVLAAVGAAAYALRDKVWFLRDAFAAVGKVMDFVVQKGKDFLDWTGASNFALDEQAEKITENAKKMREEQTAGFEQQIKLAQAAGKETIDMEIEKQKAIAATSVVAITALLQEQKRNGKLSEDRQKLLEEEVKTASDAINTIDVLKVQKHEGDKKRFQEDKKAYEEKVKMWDAEGARLTQLSIDAYINAAKKEEANQKERDDLLKHVELVNEYRLDEYDHINTLEQEQTDTFMTLSELREKRAIEEAEARKKAMEEQVHFQMDLALGLAAAIEGAAASNDVFLKQLSKNFLIFALSQMEKHLLAVQAVTIAEGTAKALASGAPLPIAVSRAIILTGLIKAAFGIAKQQIARFEVGTDFAPGGLAFVGEGGKELIQTPGGKTLLSPDKATLVV